MAATTLTIRLSPELKSGATAVCEYYGIDLSTAVRTFLTQMVNTNTIPLDLAYGEPNEVSRLALQETEELIANGSEAFDDVESFVAALKT